MGPRDSSRGPTVMSASGGSATFLLGEFGSAGYPGGVPHLFALQATVTSVVMLVLLGVKLFAFVDAAVRRPDAYAAAGKMNKGAWLLILGIAVLSDLLLGSFLLMIAGIVAAFVYILDARPALASVTRRR